MALDFPHPIPTGWFPLALRDAVGPGELRAVAAFGREVLVWRSAAGDGRAHVTDAHCPHLGAHFAHGGQVDGDTLRCPFHGWVFDGTGACREIPYARRVPPGVRVATWPTLERNGAIWAWHAPDGRDPDYEIPVIDEVEDPGWEEVHRRSWTIRTQIQEMAENGVDGAHFQTVHGATAVPDSEIHVAGATRVAIQKAPMRTSRGEATSVITVTNVGLGLSFTRFTGLIETTSLNFVRPIDADSTELTVVFLQPMGHASRGGTRAIIADLEKQIGEDIPIWEHKIYRPKPVLCDGDGPIAEYRSWCRQFYAESAREGG